MQETLRLSVATTAVSSNFTPTAPTSNFSSIFRPKQLHIPSPPPKDETTLTISPPLSAPKPTTSSPFLEKLLYLDSIGVDSLSCIEANPSFYSTPLSQLKSTVDFLQSLGLTKWDLRRLFPMCPEILTVSLSTTIIPATTFLLREAHVAGFNLRYVIHRRPRLLICCVERQLRPTMYFLHGTIGIEDVSMCTSLLSCSVEKKLIPQIECLQKLGFSYKDTISMLRRFPSLFCYSVEKTLQPKFDYFVVEMGRELEELVSFPQYFSYSLEYRIKPRYRICVEKGVFLALPTMLKLPEAMFQDRLDVLCNSSVPVKTSALWWTDANIIDDNAP